MNYRHIFNALYAVAMLLYVNMSHAGGASVTGGLNIYVVRHAQTLANATGVKDKRSDSTFSAQGIAQIDALTSRLQDYHFDDVLVSPTERTLLTIHPYVRQQKITAIVWPEIAECCWQKERGTEEAGQLLVGNSLQLPTEITSQFTFRDGASMFKYANRSYADGVAQIRHAVSLLKKYYFSSGKTILMVTHHHAGAVLLGELLNADRDSLPGLENASLTHLRQQQDGSFKLLMLNGAPY